MIVAGIILVVLGYWLFPYLVPQIPATIDSLCGGIGVVLIILGLLLWVLGAAGHSVDTRRHYW